MNSPVNIIVVEDEVIVALEIKEKLEIFGYRVLAVVKSGEAAVKAALEFKPDLILMDIKLKGEMNGTEASALIQTRMDIPVIYLTSYGDKEYLLKAKATNPYGYIIKPFQDQELLATIEMAVNRFRIEKELEKSRQHYLTVLKSIGDAVITADVEGKVTFLNPVAEVLTGWRKQDAIGKKIGDVFAIINEFTLEPVENPVAKIIETGAVIGLANHTLLVNKSGQRIPIDDSGAPIIDSAGKLIGIVLVFRDVTDKRKVEAKLKQDLADAGYKLSSRSFSRIADEMQPPLLAVLGACKQLKEQVDVPDQVQQGIDVICSNTLRLQQTITAFCSGSESDHPGEPPAK